MQHVESVSNHAQIFNGKIQFNIGLVVKISLGLLIPLDFRRKWCCERETVSRARSPELTERRTSHSIPIVRPVIESVTSHVRTTCRDANRAA